MGIEGRDLIDLGLGEPHLMRQRADMVGRQMAVTVLNQMEKFDQQVAPAGRVAQQRLDLVQCDVIDLPPFRGLARLSGAFFLPDAFLIIQRCHGVLP